MATAESASAAPRLCWSCSWCALVLPGDGDGRFFAWARAAALGEEALDAERDVGRVLLVVVRVVTVAALEVLAATDERTSARPRARYLAPS